MEAERQRLRQQVEEASRYMNDLRDEALRQQGDEFQRKLEEALQLT